ncbi:MAG: hypothetical protein ACK5XZ_13565 [Hyphomonadaceae bacterium]|jgi:hypothetical protein|uniref:hypothetical protein n=1 Tax=Aquidulcibacter sp. TaxID=2052990 RepID=UPI0022BE0A1C|nr:hypothetical protein [Aquidulcibacter sp.]MCE2890034.1 hypothetical protein [Hyphomonadaceae bacterium]MCZ8207468.1 hypothetical protein [Aquidulcibacter sp.]
MTSPTQAALVGFSLAAVSLVLTAQAQTASGEAVRHVPVKKLFPYYDLYLGLPPQDRDGFYLEYLIQSAGANVRPRMFYALGSVRTPIQVDAKGKILTMPDLAMLRQGKVEVPASTPSGRITLNLEPVVPLGRSIPASSVSNSVSDYAKAIGRAGPLALAIPKLTGIAFKGVPSGQVVFADGRKATLPVEGGKPVFRPSQSAMRGAVSLEFPAVPTYAEFAR